MRLQHGKANALDLELCEALHTSVEQQRGANAVVLTGTGSIFSAGVDLVRLLKEGEDYVHAFLPALRRCLTTLFEFPRPIVAAVNGHAIAGGCILAEACDHRVMCLGKGRIGVPELLVGVPFPMIAMETLRYAVPERHLRELVFGGATHAPREALELGLLDEVVEDELLLERSVERAAGLAKIPHGAFELAKRELRQPTLDFIAQHTEVQDHAVDEAWYCAEARDSIWAYMDAIASKGRE